MHRLALQCSRLILTSTAAETIPLPLTHPHSKSARHTVYSVVQPAVSASAAIEQAAKDAPPVDPLYARENSGWRGETVARWRTVWPGDRQDLRRDLEQGESIEIGSGRKTLTLDRNGAVDSRGLAAVGGEGLRTIGGRWKYDEIE